MPKRDPNRFIRDVGRRIAELRAAAGWTQAAFAERIGLGLKHVQQIELGALNLTLRSILRLADGLGVEPPELLAAPRNRTVRRGRPPREPRGE